MGALPKRKLSKGRRDRRRSHLSLNPIHLVLCPQCHSPRLPHHACRSCGSYKGTKVMEVETKSE